MVSSWWALLVPGLLLLLPPPIHEPRPSAATFLERNFEPFERKETPTLMHPSCHSEAAFDEAYWGATGGGGGP